MNCPKCDSEFESLTVDGVEIERCHGCGGLWFDANESEALRRSKSARKIDSGSRRHGRAFNRQAAVDCPRCNLTMTRVTDSQQLHIEFELCARCGGSFFDAGEFRDLSEYTGVERLRKLLDVWLAVR